MAYAALIRILRWMVFAVPFSACTVQLDEEELGSSFAHTQELCVKEVAPDLQRGGAFSLSFSEGAYFVFGETISGTGEAGSFLNNTGATLAAGSDPCGAISNVLDGSGKPAQIIPLTEEEQVDNAELRDGRRVAVWPMSGFVRDGEGLVYYRKVRVKDYFDVVDVGVGIARLRYGQVAERWTPGAYVQEPTLLWLAPQSDWGVSAVLAPDGFAYVYGCFQRSSWDPVCRVARVSPEKAVRPDAYEYYTGQDWSKSPEQAGVILEGSPRLSVTFNEYLGKFLVVYPGFLENRVWARVADNPWGPFGRPHLLYEGEAPSAFWINDVFQHAFLAPGDGRRVLTSYYTSPRVGTPGMRFVELNLR